MVSIKYLFLPLLFGSSYAFLPRTPSNLQNIISSRAIINGIMSAVSEEVLSDNVITSNLFVNNKHSNIDIICLGLLMITIFSKTKIQSETYKLTNIKLFSDTEKSTKILLFVIMFIFSRNIENAI
jgi:hypothetical protein